MGYDKTYQDDKENWMDSPGSTKLKLVWWVLGLTGLLSFTKLQPKV